MSELYKFLTTKTFFLVSLVGCVFGYWFATHQVDAVSAEALHSYPTLYFLLTIFKCYLTVMAAFTLIQLICFRLYSHKQNLSLYALDCLALLAFFLLHLFLTTSFSPLHWTMALLTGNGYYAEETFVLMPVFKGFVSAKQFSFTNIDYSQWAGIMHTPISLASPFMQLMTFVFDLPSVSYEAFHEVLMTTFFTLAIVASFGFYLFLSYAAKIRRLYAFLGGCLFFFGGAPHVFQMFVADGGVFISSYAVFPYALLMISLAFQKNDYRFAAGAGLALASQFFFMVPHPEGVIFSLLFYGIYSVGLILFSRGLGFIPRLCLVVFSLVIFFALSAFVLVPIILDVLTGHMYIFPHNDTAVITLAPFARYIYILIVSTVISLCLMLFRKSLSPVYVSSLLLSACLLLVVYASTLYELHIGLHVWYFWRIGMYFCATVFIITLYALNEITNVLTKRSILSFCICLVLSGIALLFFPLQFITSNERADNPEGCHYYVTLQSILANYPLLSGDKANVKFIQQRLMAFENSPVISPAKNDYNNLLKAFGLTSISAATSERQIVSVAKKASGIIDNYYLDKHLFCVSSLYHWGEKDSRRILHLNMSSLYDQIPNRYSRILFAVDSGTHLGAFSGFFVNNQTTTMNTQFMLGEPLFSALYIMPRYDYVNVGGYNGLVPWNAFWSGFATDPFYRKILNIAGIDIFTVLKSELAAKSGGKVPDAIPLSSDINPMFGADFQSYRNLDSYGVAYLANKISYDPYVKHNERIIKRYFRYLRQRDVLKVNDLQAKRNQFMEAIDILYAQLMALKAKHDVIVELPPPTVANNLDDTPAGSVDIQGIVGPRALLTTHCQRKTCTLVFNIVKSPGWHAIVNGKSTPIARANFAFMAITVPEGKATVWFIYEPYMALLGYLISLVTLIGIFIRVMV